MHPIPEDLDLSGYVGTEVGTLVLGPCAITFDFYSESGISPGEAKGALSIVAEGPWVLHDGTGNLVSDSEGYALRAPCALNALLAARVTSVTIGAPEKIVFFFGSGHRLSLFTKVGGFESLSITNPGGRDNADYVF